VVGLDKVIVGQTVGINVVDAVGFSEGAAVGKLDGSIVGCALGVDVGDEIGFSVGA